MVARQHDGLGCSTQLPQRPGSQTGVPLPQQKRALGFPLRSPLQSCGHDTQFSPSPASHTRLPQTAVVVKRQSLGHVSQSSPAPDSQMPSPSHGHGPQSAGQLHAVSPAVQRESPQLAASDNDARTSMRPAP